jgi:hypothetical protein
MAGSAPTISLGLTRKAAKAAPCQPLRTILKAETNCQGALCLSWTQFNDTLRD